MPWNQTTPFGYVWGSLFSITAGTSYFIINGAVLLIFVSICLHHQAFYEMFLHSINEFERLKNKQNGKQQLCKVIDFHTTTKR